MKIITLIVLATVSIATLAGGYMAFLFWVSDSCGTNLSIHDVSSNLDYSNQSQVPDYIRVVDITDNSSASMVVLRNLITDMKAQNKSYSYIEVTGDVLTSLTNYFNYYSTQNLTPVFHFNGVYVEAGFMVC